VSLKISGKGYFLVTLVAIVIFLFIARALATIPNFFEVTGYLGEDGVEVAVPPDLAFLTQEESTPSVMGRAFKLPMAVGKVVKVTVKSGDQVKADQVIALIDDRLAKARLEMITAQQEFVAAQKRFLEEKLADLRESYIEISDKEQSLENAWNTLKATRLQRISLAKEAVVNAEGKLAEIEKNISRTQTELQQAGKTGKAVEEDQNKLSQLLASEAKLKVEIRKAELHVKGVEHYFSQKEAKLRRAILKVRAAKSEVSEAIDTLENKISAVQWRAEKVSRLKRISKWLLDLTKIRAPISGRVRELKITEGSVLFPGQPIAVISKDSVIRLDVYLPIEKLSEVREGENVKVTVTTLPDRIFKGKVAEVGKKAVFPPSSEASESLHLMRVVKVRINVLNKEGLLKAGMSATAYMRGQVASGW
jgi:multidrug resistance efflux pump